MRIPTYTTNKSVYCFSHWCMVKLQYKKSMQNHKNSHMNYPEFIKIIGELNHLQNNHQKKDNVGLYDMGVIHA